MEGTFDTWFGKKQKKRMNKVDIIGKIYFWFGFCSLGIYLGRIGMGANIGTTAKNSKVDAYVKSNPTFSPATAWDADTMAYIAQSAGSVGFTLPFPAQTSYAYSMPANSSNGMIYADLGSGNKNTAYGQALVAAGFELDAENSSAADNLYVYTKTITERQGLQGAKIALVGLSYSTATDEAATKVWIIQVDGRDTWTYLGATPYSMAQIALHLGAWNMTRFDGGGSSSMWVRGKGTVSHPSDSKGERSCMNYWLVRIDD